MWGEGRLAMRGREMRTSSFSNFKASTSSSFKTAVKGNSTEERQLLHALLHGRSKLLQQQRWNDFVRRYERLITSCVLKVLRRYGAMFTSEDLDDLVGDVW